MKRLIAVLPAGLFVLGIVSLFARELKLDEVIGPNNWKRANLK
jgi:hypothetical protein